FRWDGRNASARRQSSFQSHAFWRLPWDHALGWPLPARRPPARAHSVSPLGITSPAIEVSRRSDPPALAFSGADDARRPGQWAGRGRRIATQFIVLLPCKSYSTENHTRRRIS